MIVEILKKYIFRNKINLLACFICGLFLIMNLLTLSDYGVSWDEPVQQEVSIAAISYIKTGNLDNIVFSDNDLKFYGPFFGILDHFSAKIASTFFNLNHIDSHHILLVIFSSIGLLVLYFFVKKLFDEKTAIFSLLFIALFPRFIGDSHYNPKDIPLMIFSVIVLFLLFLVFNKEKGRYAVFAGIFFGLALSIRVDSLLFLPIFLISYLAYFIWIKTKFKDIFSFKRISLFGLFFFSSAATLFLTWPSLWKNPLLFFYSISYFLHHGWTGSVLYSGKIYAGNNLPWHYMPVYLLITTPVLTLLFLSFGLFVSFKKIIHKDIKLFSFILIILWLFIPLFVQMRSGIVKYDGIRHFFIAIPALAILAGLGLNYAMANLRLWFPKSFKLLLALPLLIISIPLYEIIKAHPYEGYYFNEPLRYLIPRNIEKYFDVEYWGTSYREGLVWLNKNVSEKTKICVPIASHLIKEYELWNDLTFNCVGHYDYLMFPSRNSALLEYTAKETGSSDDLVFQVRRFDSAILSIYKINN